MNKDFQAKCYKESALIMFDIAHIVCFYACVICMGLKLTIWIGGQSFIFDMTKKITGLFY